MRRDVNTCSSQSAMHHGVPVRVFFHRSSEHHSRNDSSSSSTSWSHDSHVFSHSRTLVVPGNFLRVPYNNIYHHIAFARDLEENEKNTEQNQPAVCSAVAAPPPAAAAEAAAAEVRLSMTCRFVDGQGKRGECTYSEVYRRSCRSLPLMLSCLTVSFSCGVAYARGNRTAESEKKQTSVYLIKRKMKKKYFIHT